MFHSQILPSPDHCQFELLILDDANQHPPQKSPRPSGERGSQHWELIPRPVRFRTLGDKFNALCRLAADRGADAVSIWEDDDVYFPHHLAASWSALEHAEFAQPSEVFANDREGPRSHHRIGAAGRHHGAWSFRLETWKRAGGYPRETNGFDFAFQSRMLAAGAVTADILDPTDRVYRVPSYLYRWGSTGYRNASSHGDAADWLDAAATDHNEAGPRPDQLRPQLDDETAYYFQTLYQSEFSQP